MPLTRLDNILIVVNDLERVKSFFLHLGLKLEGHAVSNLIGLTNVRAAAGGPITKGHS